MYQPQSIDTSKIVLPETILVLAEMLAENVHDTWARNRISEGWTYGPQRDDARKEHPCLVPYSELPDSEKQYDRDTAIQTIKAILALGYEIREKV